MIDLATYGQAAGALLVLVGAIILLGLGARKFGLVPGIMGPLTNKRARRLRVEEVLTLDPRRRLVLIRHDALEHLLVLSADGDVVVHTGPAPLVPAPGMPRPDHSDAPFTLQGDGRP